MDDSQITAIIERSRILSDRPMAQGHYIARQAIAESRAIDGRISSQAIVAEFHAWHQREFGITAQPPTWLAVWSQHLLRGGRE